MIINEAYADDSITIQETQAIPAAPEKVESSWMSLVPMVLIFIVFYFLLIRPQEKRKRQHEEMISGVKRGEEVVTTSGIFGTVTKINDSDNTVNVQIAKDVEVKLMKTAIADITSSSVQEVNKEAKKEKAKKS